MITIVIPNYNGKHFLEDCLQSIEEFAPKDVKVLVIDNGSTDGSVSYLEDNKQIESVFLKENSGFCHAVNLGIQMAKTKYVILLNNDTKICAGYVQELVKRMESDERIFSVSPKMLMMHDPSRIDNAGDFYSALGWAKARGVGKAELDYDQGGEIFSACAGAAIYRREAFEQVGYFDESHFAYLEDVDLGYRARLCSYLNFYEPKARVEHVGSGSTGSRHNEFKVSLSARNNVFMIWKNMPLWQIFLNSIFLFLGFLIKYLFFVRKGLGKTYRNAWKKGIEMCFHAENKPKKIRKVPFRNYWNIQRLLWKNMFLIWK